MMTKRKHYRVALYLRVSTKEQTVENQRRELTAVAERHRWELVCEFADEGISGATSQRCVRTGNPRNPWTLSYRSG